MEVIRKALDLANWFVGTLEEPKNSNRGNKIDMIQKMFGFIGVQYCVLFVLYCYKKACDAQKVNYPFPKTASSQTLFDWAVKNGYAETDFTKLKHGDIVIWRKFKLWQGHAAIVKGVFPEYQAFTTIEGNTQNSKQGDQREGGGIFIRTRYFKKMDFRVDAFYLRGFIQVRKVFTDVLDAQFKIDAEPKPMEDLKKVSNIT